MPRTFATVALSAVVTVLTLVAFTPAQTRPPQTAAREIELTNTERASTIARFRRASPSAEPALPAAPVAPPQIVATPAPVVVPSVADARVYAMSHIGPSQFTCLDALWQHESNWNPGARNPSSGAYGIPQALPGSKMASFAGDWSYNPVTQVRWGLWYIGASYGNSCRAWSFWLSHHWY